MERDTTGGKTPREQGPEGSRGRAGREGYGVEGGHTEDRWMGLERVRQKGVPGTLPRQLGRAWSRF